MEEIISVPLQVYLATAPDLLTHLIRERASFARL